MVVPSSHEPPEPSVPRADRSEADASAGRYGWSSALPPSTAAGLTQPATPSPRRGRPNSAPGGGGAPARNVAQVSTQPVSSDRVHSGTCWKSPPTTSPSGTVTEDPTR